MRVTCEGAAWDCVLVDSNTVRANRTFSVSQPDGSTAPADTGRDSGMRATCRHGHLSLYASTITMSTLRASVPSLLAASRAELPDWRIGDGGDLTGSGGPMVIQITDAEQKRALWQ